MTNQVLLLVKSGICLNHLGYTADFRHLVTGYDVISKLIS
jgi:hypothetical protein